MGLLDGLKRQLRSVIEWETPNPGELFSLWSQNGDELKNASKLIVKPGQGVIFVYEGRVQSIHAEEGLYELRTANIPFLTTLTKFMQSFESEHKAGIYFFWQTEQVNHKWGTVAPLKYNDPVYKFPVGLRAFGNFSFRINKPDQFFINIVGGRSAFTVEDARKAIAQRFMQPLSDLLAESGLSYAEVDKNRDELAEALLPRVAPVAEELGFTITDFRIENTDFDEATQQRINRIADAMADNQAAQAVELSYAQMQQLGALRDAARNEGGAAGAGVGIGAGIGLGQSMAGSFSAGAQPAAAAAADPAAGLRKLKELFEQQLITQEEYEKKKAELLARL